MIVPNHPGSIYKVNLHTRNYADPSIELEFLAGQLIAYKCDNAKINNIN